MHVSKIARRYELQKNNAEAELNLLRRKFGDITNGDPETPQTSKRSRIRSPSPSELEDVRSRADDTFIYQSGHKFLLVFGPWIHLGESLFETKFNESYNVAERFENDEGKLQGQLREVWTLLRGRFEEDILRQKWMHRAVRCLFFQPMFPPELYAALERAQNRTL